jgi:hypothetical protein
VLFEVENKRQGYPGTGGLELFLGVEVGLVGGWHAMSWLTPDAMNASERCRKRGAVPMKSQLLSIEIPIFSKINPNL